jgi:hypothetical protein
MAIDLATFTFIHTALSIIAIFAGIFAVFGLLSRRPLPLWTGLFLVTAIATSVTGFGFPFKEILPSHIVGVVALLVLALGLAARFLFRLVGAWRWIYPVTIVISLYLLVFVAIAQAFTKIAVLKAAAPTLSEPPFALSQLVALVIFAGLSVWAALKSRQVVQLETA